VPLRALPEQNELLRLHDIFIHQFRPFCPFLDDIPVHEFPVSKSYIALAAASISSQLPDAATRSTVDTWDLAMRLVTTMPALDNRFTRTNDWALTWVLLHIAALVSGNMERLKILNRWHGLVISGARRTWSTSSSSSDALNTTIRKWPMEHQTLLILSFVLFDTLQSLSLDTLPVAYHTFGPTPLASPYSSIQDLLACSVFGKPDSKWPCASPTKDSLIMLTIILNEIITWGKNMHSLPSDWLDMYSSRASNLSDQSSRYLVKIRRALAKWDRLYTVSATTETRTLFHFCSLYLEFPALVYLPILANFRPCVENSVSQASSARRILQRNKQAAVGASRHAWLLFDRACEQTNLAPPWLPIITYYAALVVWFDFRSQSEGTNARGSIQLLRLFEEELRKMAWPCCSVFVENLNTLRQDSTGNNATM
jgi:hypothetical protein